MKLTTVPPIVNQAAKPQDDLSLVIHQQDWLKTISIGQIIKGKVLKVYDTNRYGVMIGGQERVVDSTISFKVGQQISAKVVSVHDNKVSLKLAERAVASNTIDAKTAPFSSSNLVDSLIRQFNMDQLADTQKQAIAGISIAFGEDISAIKMALYLAKIGLPISESIIRHLLKGAEMPTLVTTLETGLPNAISPINADNTQALYLAIAEAFLNDPITADYEDEVTEESGYGQFIPPEYIPDAAFEKSGFNSDSESEQAPFMQLLNIDTEGTIAHSFDVLAMIVNDRLMEFDVAFFDQANTQQEAILSKQVMFELETLMGKVGIVAKLVNNRLSVAFNTDRQVFLEVLQQQQESLSRSLNDAGWILEQMHYEQSSQRISAIGAVVNHVLTQGSMEIVL